MAVYLTSMAPGLTWANYGADGGDLITAAATGGVAHPSGYPLYLLLARLFQYLPIGTLAYRTNLMSAFSVIAAAVLVYGIVIQYLEAFNLHWDWMAGLAAGLGFGLAPLVWSQALITEVYALNMSFIALMLYLATKPLSRYFTEKRQDWALGLVFGLAMGNHLTAFLFLPVILATTIQVLPDPGNHNRWSKKWKLDGHSLFRRITGVGIGLLVYLTLPLRALSHPPVNWGNAATLDGFVWLISGKPYQGLLFNLDLLSILERARNTLSLLLAQFGLIGLFVGLIGMIAFHKPCRLNLFMVWTVSAFSLFAIGYGTSDALLYMLPAFLCFSIWIGIGLQGLMDLLARRISLMGPLVTTIFILALLAQAWGNRAYVDASNDLRAEVFGRTVFTIAPAHAIVFAKGDEAVFTAWYFQYALGYRSDLAIIATDLLDYAWYTRSLHETYLDLNISSPFPFAESIRAANPGRPICNIRYIQAPEINCLP